VITDKRLVDAGGVGDGVKGGAPASPGTVTLDQKGCVYVPHVQAATVGSKLELRSGDATMHNVHGKHDTGRMLFNVGMPVGTKPVAKKLRREGLSTLREHHYEAIMDTFKNNTRLVRTFVPQRFKGDILLFVATESEVTPPVESWRPYVGREIRVHPIDCAHDNMMDPIPAAKIGAVLARELEYQERRSAQKIKGVIRDKSV